MPADPTSFDHFRRGLIVRVQKAKTDETGLDYYRRGVPLSGIVVFTAIVVTPGKVGQWDEDLYAKAWF